MDIDCDYLLYSRGGDNAEKEIEVACDGEPCLHCTKEYAVREKVCSDKNATPYDVSFDEALTGRMVPYVEVLEERSIPTEMLFDKSETPVSYVKDGDIVSLQHAIHLRDVSPNGVWLSDKTACGRSLSRLRMAGLMCIQLPELNRVVLEHKNDDGLLYLTNKWLSNKENMDEGIELFGAFVCDAMLAPVLHEILRSDWIEDRKEAGETNNELKLGWAQEFYDWTRVPKTGLGSAVFARHVKCPSKPHNGQGYRIVGLILDRMRWCGYTPWSAVQAVRCSEVRIMGIACAECRTQVLTSCAFLVECAAVEASRQRDWLVRNEAVIQLCSLLYHIHEPEGADVKQLLEAWTESILMHSVRFREYKAATDSMANAEALVVMFANDHLGEVSAVKPTNEAGVLIMSCYRSLCEMTSSSPSETLTFTQLQERMTSTSQLPSTS